MERPRPVVTPAQETLVHLPTEGQFLVRGAAGSGKTTVAVARALHLARQPMLHGAPRILLLAHSAALAAELRTKLAAGGAGLERRVDVDALADWTRTFLARGAAAPELLSAAQSAALVDAALHLVRRRSKSLLLKRPLSFFTTEIESMLLALGIERFEEYTPVARESRGSPLDEEARRTIFAVFAEYRALARRLGRSPPLALVPAALARLEQERRPPYDHVVVDDAHRLAPIELKLVRALATGGSLTLFAALEQKFDPIAANLRELGLGRLDRTEVLPKILRGPAPLFDAALAVVRRPRAHGATGANRENGLKAIDPGAIDGARPRLLLCENWEQEFVALVAEVERLRRDGRALAEVAVLAPSEGARALAAAALAQLPVTLCLIEEAAGREFPVVIVLDVNRGCFPRDRRELAEHERAGADDEARRSLYAAMTRATAELVLIATEATRSPLLPLKKLTVEKFAADAGGAAAAASGTN